MAEAAPPLTNEEFLTQCREPFAKDNPRCQAKRTLLTSNAPEIFKDTHQMTDSEFEIFCQGQGDVEIEWNADRVKKCLRLAVEKPKMNASADSKTPKEIAAAIWKVALEAEDSVPPDLSWMHDDWLTHSENFVLFRQLDAATDEVKSKLRSRIDTLEQLQPFFKYKNRLSCLVLVLFEVAVLLISLTEFYFRVIAPVVEGRAFLNQINSVAQAFRTILQTISGTQWRSLQTDIAATPIDTSSDQRYYAQSTLRSNFRRTILVLSVVCAFFGLAGLGVLKYLGGDWYHLWHEFWEIILSVLASVVGVFLAYGLYLATVVSRYRSLDLNACINAMLSQMKCWAAGVQNTAKQSSWNC